MIYVLFSMQYIHPILDVRDSGSVLLQAEVGVPAGGLLLLAPVLGQLLPHRQQLLETE